MTDAEIFGKLSRIFETHAFSFEDNEEDIEELLDDFDNGNFRPGNVSNRITEIKSVGNERPKPYEVWVQKNKHKLDSSENKQTPKLTADQWDRLVDKMHQSNRTKQSAMIKEQNQGLALELGGYLFKPRLNKTSLDLSSTMKSLHLRMPEMIAERNKELDTKRKEAAELEVAECTFSPDRGKSKKVSEKYLARMGRKKLKPEDLIKYENEKEKRREMRKQIIDELEKKELTFRPQIGDRSLKLQEKLLKGGVLSRDPFTRTTVSQQDGTTKPTNFRQTSELTVGDEARFEDGPMLVIESEHPYRNNTNEFTTVQVQGAVSYLVSFHENTKTEAIHDYVKFFDDETHTYFFGAGKYSGGTAGSSYNWPGIGQRPSLVIPAPKFIIQFKTNGSINDWGFRMHIIPRLLVNNGQQNLSLENISITSPAIPNISDAAKHFKPNEKVHERLYKHGLQKHSETHNKMVDLMQSKLNINLKPWETPRVNQSFDDLSGEINPAHHYVKLYGKTHHAKAPLSEAVEELLISENNMNDNVSTASTVTRTQKMLTAVVKIGEKYVSVVEFDDSLTSLWKQLRI